MRIKRITAAPLLGALFIMAACTGSPAAAPSAPAAATELPTAPATPPGPKSGPGPAGLPAPVETPVSPVPPAAQTTPNTTTPPVGPSQFLVSDLKITPNGVRLGELTTVTVNVTNLGAETATYKAVIKATPAWPQAKIIILPAANQDVNLTAGESKIITFQVSMMGNGYCIVEIEDHADRFIVDSQI